VDLLGGGLGAVGVLALDLAALKVCVAPTLVLWFSTAGSGWLLHDKDGATGTAGARGGPWPEFAHPGGARRRRQTQLFMEGKI
jgi:hypothetical protein